MLKLIFTKDDFFLQNKISVISGSTVAPQENDARFAIHPQGMIL